MDGVRRKTDEKPKKNTYYQKAKQPLFGDNAELA